jgi:spermidine/putrescine transport system permease protein
MTRVRNALTNPWGKARFLWVVGIGYVLWTLLPVVNAVLMSFNASRSISIWAGFSWRWWFTDPNESILHDPNLRHALFQSVMLAAVTALVAVPIGVAFALATDRWRSRSAASANALMMVSFVTPELILAVGLFLLFINALKIVGLGTLAQSLGLILLAIAYPVVIVRARLLALGPEYEQAAMDLGAPPLNVLRRITLPLLAPAVFASAAIVFAFSLDDFVIVNQLARDQPNTTVSMYIYGAARTSPSPAANAIGSLALFASTIIIALAFLVYRRSTRGMDSGREDAEAVLGV